MNADQMRRAMQKAEKAKKPKEEVVEGEVVAAKADPKLLKRIKSLAAAVDKKFGKGRMLVLDEDSDTSLEGGGISTGFQEIDDVLSGTVDKEQETVKGSGVGFPRGRIIEVFGPESSGKTTLALIAIAEEQRRGGVCAFVDAEHALDTQYAKGFGIDLGALLVSQPDTAEEALNIVDMLVRAGVDLIVVDSVSALTPEKEVRGEMGDQHMGLHARLMSQACRKINGLLKPGGTTVIFINQIRMKVGVVFGNPETTSGGNALKFYASIRCDLRIISQVFKKSKDGGDKKRIGQRIRMKTIKNKVAPPFQEVIYDVIMGKGVRIPSKERIRADRQEQKERYAKKK